MVQLQDGKRYITKDGNLTTKIAWLSSPEGFYGSFTDIPHGQHHWNPDGVSETDPRMNLVEEYTEIA